MECGIKTYFVGVDPYLILEHYNTWSCSECNLSGSWTHTLECVLCEYEEVVPHGIGFNIENKNRL